jgi:hypothetical protein
VYWLALNYFAVLDQWFAPSSLGHSTRRHKRNKRKMSDNTCSECISISKLPWNCSNCAGFDRKPIILRRVVIRLSIVYIACDRATPPLLTQRIPNPELMAAPPKIWFDDYGNWSLIQPG